MEFTDLQIQMLLELSTDEGLSNKQLAERLGKKESNTIHPLAELEDEGLIFKEQRIDRVDKRRTDFPYYLEKSRSLEIFKSIFERLIKKNPKKLQELFDSNLVSYIIKNFDLLTF